MWEEGKPEFIYSLAEPSLHLVKCHCSHHVSEADHAILNLRMRVAAFQEEVLIVFLSPEAFHQSH